MRKILRPIPFLLLLFVFDRFLFLPGRMNGTWEYEKGTYIGDPITFDNIDILSNFKIEIQKHQKFDSFYLLGCYFGQLYLLDEDTWEFTQYVKSEDADSWLPW